MEIQAELDGKLRGRAGFVGTGWRDAPVPTLLVYVNQNWKQSPDLSMNELGIRVEFVWVGDVRPL